MCDRIYKFRMYSHPVMEREWVEEANAINRTKFYSLFVRYYCLSLSIHILSCVSRLHLAHMRFAHTHTHTFVTISFRHTHEKATHIDICNDISKMWMWRNGVFIVRTVYFIIIIILTIFQFVCSVLYNPNRSQHCRILFLINLARVWLLALTDYRLSYICWIRILI